MIEADINATPSAESVDSNNPQATIELFGTARLARKRKLVTYDRFVAEYCPKFEQSRFRELDLVMARRFYSYFSDPLLIFNEITGLQLSYSDDHDLNAFIRCNRWFGRVTSFSQRLPRP